MLPATTINGQLQPSSPGKPAEMLLQQPKGPYTTAHITAGRYIEAWQLHMLRLAQAVLRLHQLDGASYEQLLTSLQVMRCHQRWPLFRATVPVQVTQMIHPSKTWPPMCTEGRPHRGRLAKAPGREDKA